MTPPHVGSYRGLVFANLDPHAEPTGRRPGRLSLLPRLLPAPERGRSRGLAQRWRVQCNWKIGAENFAGDSYHTPHTHASIVDIGLFREPTANKRKEGALYLAGGGGGTTYKLPSETRPRTSPTSATRTRWWSACSRCGPPSISPMVGPGRFMVSAATAFPNLSFVHNWPQVRREGGVVPFVSVRLWQPVSARPRRSASRGSRSTRARPTTSRTPPIGPTCCASARRGCSSRTTSRTGRRSPTWPRATSAPRSSWTARWGWRPAAAPSAARPSGGTGPARRSSGMASTTSAPCCLGGPRHLASAGGR